MTTPCSPILASDSGIDLDTIDEPLTDDDWAEIIAGGFSLDEARDMWGEPPARLIGLFREQANDSSKTA